MNVVLLLLSRYKRVKEVKTTNSYPMKYLYRIFKNLNRQFDDVISEADHCVYSEEFTNQYGGEYKIRLGAK
jgi:hypothetical protein